MNHLLLRSSNPAKRIVMFFFLGALSCNCVFAQQDTASDSVIIEKEDTVLMKSYAARFDPRKALLYAAIVPGLGQVYNKKYWKLPLVYGGFVAIGYNISRFHIARNDFKEQLYYNLQHGLFDPNDENPITGFTTQQLRSAEGKARRQRDFWMIMMGAMYLLQMVDAHVDAHLKEFDLNPNLRVRVEPTLEKSSILGRQTGVAVTIKF
jgi:hypothetical protein